MQHCFSIIVFLGKVCTYERENPTLKAQHQVLTLPENFLVKLVICEFEMYTTNKCFVRKCPNLPFNCRYAFWFSKVNICRISETKIKRFIMFIKLQLKFLKYQLLVYSPVKRYWFPRWFFWFFWFSFLAVINAAPNCHCFLHQITKKVFNICIIYMIKLEILLISI